MHKYTPEDLLLYLYKEVSPEQALAIEQELKLDWALREKAAVMKTAMERLDRITEEPRTEIVLNVLHYAAKTQTIPSQS